MEWAGKELRTIQLGDSRLNARAKNLLGLLGASPSESIPSSCQGWAETKAAYRFFDHESVSAEKIFEPHRQATLERIKAHPVVLFIQDTTTLNYTGQKQRDDIGPIQRDNARGLFIHPTMAVTPERHCLGVINYYQWSREELAHKPGRERSKMNHQRPMSEKESYRWVEGYKKANEIAQQLPQTRIVSIADREGDIYDVYEEAKKQFNTHSAHWLIRAHYDRLVQDAKSKNRQNKLKASVKEAGAIGTLEFETSSSHEKAKRKVKQEIFLKEVNLLPSARKKKNGGYPVTTTVIIASEINAPMGEKPLEWVLLTSIPVKNLEDAHQIIQWYLCRWQIEIYFKILKSGCKIEKLPLTHEKRFNPCLALYMIIAWRILLVTMLGRAYPHLECDSVFNPTEWQTAYIIVNKKKPPSKPPKLTDIVKIIARLGGFMDRKNDGEPGPNVMWIGLRNLHEHIKAREVFENVFGHTYG